MPRGRKNKNRSGTSTLPRNNAAKSSPPPIQQTAAAAAAVATSPLTKNDDANSQIVNIIEKLPEVQQQITAIVDDQTDALSEAKAKLEQIQEKINTIEETLSATQAIEEDSNNQNTDKRQSSEESKVSENSSEKSNGNDHQQTLKRKRNRNKKKKCGGNEPINKERENSPDSIDLIQSSDVQKTEDLVKEKENSPKLTVSPATELKLESNSKKGKKNKNAKNVEQNQNAKIETVNLAKQAISKSEENVKKEKNAELTENVNVANIEKIEPVVNVDSVKTSTKESEINAEKLSKQPPELLKNVSSPTADDSSAKAEVPTMAELLKSANLPDKADSASENQLKTETVAETCISVKSATEPKVAVDSLPNIEPDTKVASLAAAASAKSAKAKSKKTETIKMPNTEQKPESVLTTDLTADQSEAKVPEIKDSKPAKKSKAEKNSEPKNTTTADIKLEGDKPTTSIEVGAKEPAKVAESPKIQDIIEPEATVAESDSKTSPATSTTPEAVSSSENISAKTAEPAKNTIEIKNDIPKDSPAKKSVTANTSKENINNEKVRQQSNDKMKSEKTANEKAKPNQKQTKNDKKQSVEKKTVEVAASEKDDVKGAAPKEEPVADHNKPDAIQSESKTTKFEAPNPQVGPVPNLATFATTLKDLESIPTIEQLSAGKSSAGNQEKNLQAQIDENIAKLLELSSKSKQQAVSVEQKITSEPEKKLDVKPSIKQDTAGAIKPDEPIEPKQEHKPVQKAESKSDKTKKIVTKTEKQTSQPKVFTEPKTTEANIKPSIGETVKKQSSPTPVKQEKQTTTKKISGESVKIQSDPKSTTASVSPQPVKPSSLKGTEADEKGGSPIILKEDETVKIWKILEEASKSLDPVEIEVDAGCKSTKSNETKQKDSELVSTPGTNPNILKQTDDSFLASTLNDHLLKEQLLSAAKAGNENVAPKTGQKGGQKSSKPQPATQKSVKENSPTKVVDSQPKRSGEAKKQQQSMSTTSKPKLAAPPPSTPPEEKPPSVDLNPAPDIEIPLDMSMISSTNLETDSSILELTDDLRDTKNLAVEDETQNLTDSKNVQGSDFAQFAKASAISVESRETINSNTESNEGNRKSVSPSIEKQNKNEINSQQSKSQAEQKPQVAAVRLMDILEPKMVQPDPFPRGKTNKNKKNCVKKPEKQATIENKPENERKIAETTHNNSLSNSKECEQKPTIPPKPEHLGKSRNTNGIKLQNKRSPSLPSTDDEEDYIEYKFMPRQVFICTICQTCKVPLQSEKQFLCEACEMVRYCSIEHLSSNKPAHKSLCQAVQEIAKKRGGHIYNNARILSNDDFRSLRVHTLNICENILKRSLETYEREILLFPRICAKPTCREWRHNLLSECKMCGQVFYCTSSADHLPESHSRWCKAFDLYQKLVVRQNISGRIEPPLPSKVMTKPYSLPSQIDDVFKDLYKNYSAIKDECVYATLTQLATAPLTAFFGAQISGRMPEDTYTIHLVGAELQFEADILNVWETFFLHLAPKLVELNIVFCGPELNAENLPLEILSRIRMCRICRLNCRIVKFDFQCGKLYHEYAKSSSFMKPDLICFYNPGLYRKTGFNGLDTWPETIRLAVSMCCPIIVTSYTEFESPRDLERLQNEAAKIQNQRELSIVSPSKLNLFSSQRPERNFVSDEMAPMIFKNFYCFVVK